MGYNMPRKTCPQKLCCPELPQECIGPKCEWFMNRQDCCAIKVIAKILGNNAYNDSVHKEKVGVG